MTVISKHLFCYQLAYKKSTAKHQHIIEHHPPDDSQNCSCWSHQSDYSPVTPWLLFNTLQMKVTHLLLMNALEDILKTWNNFFHRTHEEIHRLNLGAPLEYYICARR